MVVANGTDNGNGNGNGSGRWSGGARPNRREAGREDRLPPYNLEAEQSVLGGILLDNEVLHDVAPLLKPRDFFRDSHQIIFGVIREMYDQGKAIDSITLVDEMTRRELYEKVGGDETLEDLLNTVPHAANTLYYANIVHQKAVVRDLIETAEFILEEGYANKHTAENLVELAEQRVFAIAEDQVAGQTVELRELLDTALGRIEARALDRHAVTGISTGYFELDDITAGLQPSQLVVLAARPSMGKTALALNICENIAVQSRKGVLFVSLEMGRLELAERLLSARAKINGHDLRTGKGLGTREMNLLAKAIGELHNSPFFIDDTPTRNMLQITATARRLKRRESLDVIVVDYIQLIDSEESRDSRQEQIAKISRRLKTLARELKVPVIALSQLNRNVENREDRRPRMADLRESGAIEQDADLVLLLHRPEYYDPNDQPGIAELQVAKNRNGATGTVKFTFLKNFTRFENFSAVVEPIDAGTF